METIEQNTEQAGTEQTAVNADTAQTSDPQLTNDSPAEPTGEVQAQIDAALAKQQSDFTTQLEQATGHKDFQSLNEANLKDKGQYEALANTYKDKYEQAQINFAILAESAEAVSPSFVKDHLSGKAVCDENGNVTIDGKPVTEAVKNLLDEHPFLAKPQGGPGSGAPQSRNLAMHSMSRAEFERLPAAKRSEFLNNGGKVKD